MLLISIWTVAGAVAGGHGMRQRAAVLDPEFLERPQRGAGGATDVVGAGLEPVELLDDRERHDHVDVLELEHARGIGDQHRGVEHESRSLPDALDRAAPISCASEPVELAVRSAVGSPVDGSRSVNVTPRRMDRSGGSDRDRCATGSVVADARRTMVDGGGLGGLR